MLTQELFKKKNHTQVKKNYVTLHYLTLKCMVSIIFKAIYVWNHIGTRTIAITNLNLLLNYIFEFYKN